MAITYSQFVHGFYVTAGSNDKIDFVEAGVTRAGTLAAGFYTPGGYAAEVQRAMQAAAVTSVNLVSFSWATLKFTLTGTATFSLLFGSGVSAATNCALMLGFVRGGGVGNDKTGLASYASTTAVSATYSATAPTVWTMAEPNDYTSPVTAQAEAAPVGATGQAGTAALLTRRKIYGAQNITDGAVTEGIYFSTIRWVEIGFRALTSAEQTKMETFLNWATQMKPFSWQPDSTSGNAVRLVADFDSTKTINNDWEWLTRSETSYGRLRFYEDLTR